MGDISKWWNSTKIGERCKNEKARGGSTKIWERDVKKRVFKRV